MFSALSSPSSSVFSHGDRRCFSTKEQESKKVPSTTEQRLCSSTATRSAATRLARRVSISGNLDRAHGRHNEPSFCLWCSKQCASAPEAECSHFVLASVAAKSPARLSFDRRGTQTKIGSVPGDLRGGLSTANRMGKATNSRYQSSDGASFVGRDILMLKNDMAKTGIASWISFAGSA